MKAVADFTRGPVTGPLSRRMNSATVVAEWMGQRLHVSARLIFDHSLPGDKFAFQVRIPLTLDTDSAHKPITCSG